MTKGKTIRPTIGDLIVALAEEVEPYAHDEREISILVSYLLIDLCRTHPRVVLGPESTGAFLADGSFADEFSSRRGYVDVSSG
jgi:hypothetical protein